MLTQVPYHQLVYQFHNHAMNLSYLGFQGDPLFITAEHEDVPSIVHIPRQLAPKKLRELIPLDWFTNYEQIHRATTLVVSMDPNFQPMLDRIVNTTLVKPNTENPTSLGVFHTLMITPTLKPCDPNLDKDIPINSSYLGETISYVNHYNDHFLWDVDPSMCHLDCDCDLDDECYSSRRQKGKLLIFLQASLTQPCMMFFTASPSYSDDFPPLDKQGHSDLRTYSRPFIQQRDVLLDDITNLMMVDTIESTEPMVEEPLKSQATCNVLAQPPIKGNIDGLWFCFEPLPSSQWCSKMHEFSAWIDNQLVNPTFSLKAILKEFSLRFTRFV
ncbi:hypothetical protein FNV43_RR00142 [Rhamnella rubrinervis]|uniref:Uncharacterized protein n=1 Tax=Rhamnella rubrinervis TaxID=2594499 RepID=A0A8K0MR52_9ROSA|nr:hypothetical protein FNV43_RR00142 [Rhamnella rubrinervis]